MPRRGETQRPAFRSGRGQSSPLTHRPLLKHAPGLNGRGLSSPSLRAIPQAINLYGHRLGKRYPIVEDGGDDQPRARAAQEQARGGSRPYARATPAARPRARSRPARQAGRAGPRPRTPGLESEGRTRREVRKRRCPLDAEEMTSLDRCRQAGAGARQRPRANGGRGAGSRRPPGALPRVRRRGQPRAAVPLLHHAAGGDRRLRSHASGSRV